MIDSVGFYLNKITFSDSVGFCVGSYGYILRSTDNGNTWKFATAINSYEIANIGFNGSSGYCIADKTIFATTDNGNTWVQKFKTDYNGMAIFPLSINNPLILGTITDQAPGCFGGGKYHTEICQSTNSGNDWIKTPLKDLLNCSSFYSVNVGYAISDKKLIKITVK